MIPEGFITGLLERADIVDVINRYVPLKKAGRNWMCCCPSTKRRRRPSPGEPDEAVLQVLRLAVEAGNAIGFIMKYEGLEFPDAVRKLAGYYSMEVPRTARPQRSKPARRRARSRTTWERPRPFTRSSSGGTLGPPITSRTAAFRPPRLRSSVSAIRPTTGIPFRPFRREVFRQGA